MYGELTLHEVATGENGVDVWNRSTPAAVGGLPGFSARTATYWPSGDQVGRSSSWVVGVVHDGVAFGWLMSRKQSALCVPLSQRVNASRELPASGANTGRW